MSEYIFKLLDLRQESLVSRLTEEQKEIYNSWCDDANLFDLEAYGITDELSDIFWAKHRLKVLERDQDILMKTEFAIKHWATIIKS